MVKAQAQPLQQLVDPPRLKESFVFWENDLKAVLPDTAKGKKIIRVFHTPLSPSQAQEIFYDNDVLDYTTLQPLEKHLPYGSVFYSYDKKGIVRTMCVSAKDTVYKEMAVPGRVYHLQGPAAGLFVSTLPLRVGLKADFHALFSSFPYSDQYNLKIEKYQLSVVKQETIQFQGKPYETFVVVIDSKSANTGLYFKQWVTKQPPHEALQFIYSSKSTPDYASQPPYVVRAYLPVK